MYCAIKVISEHHINSQYHVMDVVWSTYKSQCTSYFPQYPSRCYIHDVTLRLVQSLHDYKGSYFMVCIQYRILWLKIHVTDIRKYTEVLTNNSQWNKNRECVRTTLMMLVRLFFIALPAYINHYLYSNTLLRSCFNFHSMKYNTWYKERGRHTKIKHLQGTSALNNIMQ